MKTQYTVRIHALESPRVLGPFIAYLSHKGRTNWSHRTALKHATDYLRNNPGHGVRVEEA
jgi:hypothetical protein